MTIKALHVDGNNIYFAGSRYEISLNDNLEMAVKYIQSSSSGVSAVPEAFEPFDNIDFSAYAKDRDWCWTDILIDWKLNPICIIPPICPSPNVSASLWSGGKLSWSKKFDKPFHTSLPDLKKPQLFKLALVVDQKFQDVIVLDENLVSNGISNLSLSAYPGEKTLKMNVETINGESVPFTMTLLNGEGKSIWQKEFMAPLSEEINELVSEKVMSLRLSAVSKELNVNYYPNPFIENLTVSIDKNIKLPAQVSVISIQGKTMYQQTIEAPGNISVNMKGQKAGLYILVLKTQDAEIRELIELK
jgi:hypothetical protein